MAMYQPPYMPQQYGYQPMPMMPQPMQAPQQQQPQSNGIVWVQGEQAAKSYLVGAGNSVLLMDSDATRFYLKSADNSGMPLPLRIFEYKEIQPGQQPPVQTIQTEDFVTRKEFDELKAMIDQMKEVRKNAKPAV